jgi:hypothetical protein
MSALPNGFSARQRVRNEPVQLAVVPNNLTRRHRLGGMVSALHVSRIG